MGSPKTEPCRGGDEDQHAVTLTRDFELQDTEVTQGQFEAVMGYNPSHFSSAGGGKTCGASCPVEMVSWHESAAYCNALSKMAGNPVCYACTGTGANTRCSGSDAYGGTNFYSCPGYRLPTEAEWEYAYRAGTTTAFYNGTILHCHSADLTANAIAWYYQNSALSTHGVATKQRNNWKLSDMAGNVWEWCHDWFSKSLGTSPVTDPAGPSSGQGRAKRGGSWYSTNPYLRAAERDMASATSKFPSTGFRCARGR